MTGIITSFNTEDRTFTMTPTQYSVLQHTATKLPIRAYFADMESKRWGENGPKVAVGSTITFGGLLQRVVRERNLERTLSFIEIEVHTIAYLANPNNPTSPSSTYIIIICLDLFYLTFLNLRNWWRKFRLSKTMEL